MAIDGEFNGNDLICTECYQIDTPDHAHYGSWPKFLPVFIIIAAMIAVPSVLYLGFIFIIFVVSKGKFTAIETIDLFPLGKYLPEAPYSVVLCKHCKKVNSMVRIKDPEGQTAIFFHKKYHVSERVKKNEQVQQPQANQNPPTQTDTEDILARLAKDETQF